MMTKIREKTHIFLWILVFCFIALIVIEWGARYSDTSRTKRGVIGKIDGSDVRYIDFQSAYYNQVQQAQQQKDGQSLSESELESISDQIWNQVVEEMLLREFIRRNHISVGDSEIAYTLRTNPPDFLRQSPSFQTDGKFDANKYLQALNNPQFAGDWSQIEGILRQQLPFNKVQSLIGSAVQVTESEMRLEYMRRNLKLSGQFVYFSPAEFKVDSIAVSDDDLDAYYKSHRDDFKEKAKSRLAFVNFSTEATAEDTAEVLQKIQDVHQQALQGKDFAELAATYSEDKAANQNGGSLGWFTRGMMVKEFEDACFSGKPGQVVGPIQTQFGYHIIKIEDIRLHGGQKKKTGKDAIVPQDSVKASHILIKMSASQQTIEIARENANAFYETAKESGFDAALGKFGGRYGLKVDTTAEILDNDQGMIGGFPDRLRTVLRFAFNDPIGSTSRPYRTSYGFTLFECLERSPAGFRPLEQVKDRVRIAVIEEKRKDLAYQRARDFRSQMNTLADVKNKDTSIVIRDLNGFAMSSGIPGVGRDPKFASALFDAPIGKLADVIRGIRGCYLAVVTTRDEFDEKKYQESRKDIKRQLQSAKQQRAYRDWLDALKKSSTIEDFRADFNL